jgi:hypothetical protein
MYAEPGNSHGGRASVWCKAIAVNQELMIQADPTRFFKPPYVGPSGWVGVYLDRRVDWKELAEILRDAWQLSAPKRLLRQSVEPARGPHPGAARKSRPRKAPARKPR